MTSTELLPALDKDSPANTLKEASTPLEISPHIGVRLYEDTTHQIHVSLPSPKNQIPISNLESASLGILLGPCPQDSIHGEFLSEVLVDSDQNGVGNNNSIDKKTSFFLPARDKAANTKTNNTPTNNHEVRVATKSDVATVFNDGDDVAMILNAAREAEGDQEFDEDSVEIPIGAPAVAAANNSETTKISGAVEFMTRGAMKKLKKSELASELSKRGVSSQGLVKSQCLTLLQESILLPLIMSKKSNGVPSKPKKLTGFPEGAFWKELQPNSDVVPEPVHEFKSARAPTVPESESHEVPVKHNFLEDFDRQPFIGSIVSPKKGRNGKYKHDIDGNCIDFKNEIINKGRIRSKFVQLHGLSAVSTPVQWMDPFWPRKAVTGKFSISQCAINSNLQATLNNAGPGGTTYPKFTSFSVDELQKFMGIQIVQGLSPSPRIQMKFKSPNQSPFNGNDLIRTAMGPNAEERWKHFKSFFAIQDPRKLTPDRKAVPNFIYLWGLGVMLVNAYVSYKTYHLEIGTPKKNILSQYEFRESIALAWIKPDVYWPTRNSRKNKTADKSSGDRNKKTRRESPRKNSAVPYVPQQKAIYCTDVSLHGTTGKLKCRLDHYGLIHLPVVTTSKKPVCACHRWAIGNRKTKTAAQVFSCKICKVHLCVKCFDKFHTVADVEKLRESILVA